MSRIPTPTTIDTSPAASQPLLEAVKKQLGSVPNLFRIVGNSPAGLEGYLGLNGALGHGTLDVRTRQRLAIRVAELNGCDYCLSAHTYLGKNVAKLDDAEMAANRDGASSDGKARAALVFASEVVRTRGHVKAQDVAALKDAGYDDAAVVEILLHVALNTLTNYVNTALATEVDFPKLVTRAASSPEHAVAE